MVLDVVIPGCARVMGDLHDQAGGSSTAWLRLLVRASKRNVGTCDRWLCERAGVLPQPARDLPLGALCRYGELGAADEKWWLRVDLVHKRADRDSLVLLGRESVIFDPKWSELLAARVRPLFEEEHLDFEVGNAGRWYIGAERDPQLRNYDPDEAMGKDLNEFLPTGEGRRKWQRLATELQMVMHQLASELSYPALSERGPNSVWFWGVGVLPAELPPQWSVVFADDSLTKGLARLANTRQLPVPSEFEQWRRESQADNSLLVLPHLEAAAEPLGDHQAPEIFAQFSRQWLEPLAAWLSRGSAPGARLHLGGGVVYEIEPANRWKWWRRASLQQILAPSE